MIQSNPNDKDHKDKNDQAGLIKPDPETLGPEPQEHMEGPISSLVKKVEHMMDDNDHDGEEKKHNKELNK